MSDLAKDRRLSARIKGKFKITIMQSNEKIVVNTIDLSLSGLRFKSKKHIPLFREISICLSLPAACKTSKSQAFNCSAIVVRSLKSNFDNTYNIALTFVDVTEKYRGILKKFLESNTKKKIKS